MTHILFAAMAGMSLAAFALMGIDKAHARARKRRIPERTLFFFAVFLGALGGTLGMYVFRHKTKHWYFALFFPLLAVAQSVLLLLFALR